MNAEQIADYLIVWAKLNAEEVYGSPREYISIDALKSQLRQIKENAK